MAIIPPMEAPHSTSGPLCSCNSAAAIPAMLSCRALTSVTVGAKSARPATWARHMTALPARPGMRMRE